MVDQHVIGERLLEYLVFQEYFCTSYIYSPLRN